jgi:CBS domain-containing protein/ribosome-associated translation inhibitor RaiA
MRRSKLQDLHVRDIMSADPVTVTPEDTLGDALGKMKKHEVHELPVLRGKVLAGLVTMTGIMRRKALPPTTKVSTILEPVPEVTPDDDLPAVAEKLIQTGFRALPVVERKRLVGIVSRTDLAKAIAGLEEFDGVPVRDIMTPNLQTVSEDETLEHAIRLMQSLGERSLPVVDPHGYLVGVVGMKDVQDVFAVPKERPQAGATTPEKIKLELQAKGVMRYPVVTVGPDASVRKAAELMLKNHISSVIAVEKDTPVGVVTKLDLAELLVGRKEREEVLVQISGLEEEQPDVYEALYDIIRKAMKKISNITMPRSLTVHVQAYKAEGDRAKYSLHARFQTAHRMHYLAHFDWDLNVAMAGLMDVLERQILKQKERRVTERKRHHGT